MLSRLVTADVLLHRRGAVSDRLSYHTMVITETEWQYRTVVDGGGA